MLRNLMDIVPQGSSNAMMTRDIVLEVRKRRLPGNVHFHLNLNRVANYLKMLKKAGKLRSARYKNTSVWWKP